MKTFSIMLNMDGKLAVVVGGGPVGLRKVHALLEAGAEVKLVTEELPAEAKSLRSAGVLIIHKAYCPEHLEGATLVFACTDDRGVNAQIAQDSQWVGALVNTADQPEDCDFYMPATIQDGDVTVAVGTGGASPGLAGFLRDRLSAALPPRVGDFANALSQLRAELRDRCGDVAARAEIMKRLSSQSGYEAFLAGGVNKLRSLIG